MAPPRGGPPSNPPYAGGPQGGYVPPSTANAPTMFVPASGPLQGPQGPQGPQPPHMAATMIPPGGGGYQQPMPPGMRPPMQPQQPPRPPMLQIPIPAAQPPPYLASQTASRVSRPIEPWRDSLRAMMFLWGLALLIAFATPLQTSPELTFLWDSIIHGEGTARLPPLMLAAVGLLSVIVAAIPMQPAARGLIAAVLGLAGIAVPIAIHGELPPWQLLIVMIGTLVLVPSLLVRHEYRDAVIPRALVTLGAIAILLPFLLPEHGAIPLVGIFKALIDLPGTAKVAPALAIGLVAIVVMSLLAWLPSPVTGAAKLWAWLLILWGLITQGAMLAVAGLGSLGDHATSATNATFVAWIGGGGKELTLGAAYLVLVGYGLASVIGKQLE